MPADFLLSPDQPLTLAGLGALLASRAPVGLSPAARARIEAGPANFSGHLPAPPIHGFGAPPDTSAPPADHPQRQANLLMAHACGVGAEVPPELVRLLLLLKVQHLSLSPGAVALPTVERLLAMYNRELYPVVYEQGALAHLSLPLIGLGEVNYQGYRLAAADALSLFSWAPLRLGVGEGSALLSGSQLTLAIAVATCLRAQHLSRAADVIGALSGEAFGARPAEARQSEGQSHAGQARAERGEVARRLRALRAGSGLPTTLRPAGPDPGAFRGLLQVHGASRDAVAYAAQIIEYECNMVDEPTAIHVATKLPPQGSGHAHRQPLAQTLDHLTRAVAALGRISAQRTGLLLSGQRGLPLALVAEPGLNIGLEMVQHTAAALVTENEQLGAPTRRSGAKGHPGPDDHGSRGAHAATQARRVVENVEQILGIELLTAAQALDFRRPARTSEVLETVLAAFRQEVAFVACDRVLSPDLQRAVAFVRRFDWQ